MVSSDTSFDSIAMLVFAMLIAGFVGTGIQAVVGQPASDIGQVLLAGGALLVGFGLVYGRLLVRGYTSK